MASFLTQVGGFTPVIDIVANDVGTMSANVYGVVWRYCQMGDGVCRASLKRIAEHLNADRRTVERHIKKLCAAGYLVDLTPDLRNKPHTYADTGKVKITGLIEAKLGRTESTTTPGTPTEVGQKVPPGPDRESHPGRAESTMMIEEETIQDTNSKSGEAPPSSPSSFHQWQDIIRETTNRPAALRQMFETLYPENDLPDYGYIGKAARKVGGAGRLAELLWQISTRPPTGDVLAFVMAVAKHGGNGNHGGNRRHSGKETGRWTPEEIAAANAEA